MENNKKKPSQIEVLNNIERFRSSLLEQSYVFACEESVNCIYPYQDGLARALLSVRKAGGSVTLEEFLRAIDQTIKTAPWVERIAGCVSLMIEWLEGVTLKEDCLDKDDVKNLLSAIIFILDGVDKEAKKDILNNVGFCSLLSRFLYNHIGFDGALDSVITKACNLYRYIYLIKARELASKGNFSEALKIISDETKISFKESIGYVMSFAEDISYSWLSHSHHDYEKERDFLAIAAAKYFNEQDDYFRAESLSQCIQNPQLRINTLFEIAQRRADGDFSVLENSIKQNETQDKDKIYPSFHKEIFGKIEKERYVLNHQRGSRFLVGEKVKKWGFIFADKSDPKWISVILRVVGIYKSEYSEIIKVIDSMDKKGYVKYYILDLYGQLMELQYITSRYADMIKTIGKAINVATYYTGFHLDDAPRYNTLHLIKILDSFFKKHNLTPQKEEIDQTKREMLARTSIKLLEEFFLSKKSSRTKSTGSDLTIL